MINRIFTVIIEGFGIGELPDAEKYGDSGKNMLHSLLETQALDLPNLRALGLYNINDTVPRLRTENPVASFGKVARKSSGKEICTSYWELLGYVAENALPEFPNGLPEAVVRRISDFLHISVLCNKKCTDAQALAEYGREHLNAGGVILYMGENSVVNVAAHQLVMSSDELLDLCLSIRGILQMENGVGRVVAKPFKGSAPDFSLSDMAKDFAILPSEKILTDILVKRWLDVISVGRIYDYLAGTGFNHAFDEENFSKLISMPLLLTKQKFTGICLVNVSPADYSGTKPCSASDYINMLHEVDKKIGLIYQHMRADDALIITANQGSEFCPLGLCPTREYVPLLIFGEEIKSGVNLGTLESLSDISATIQDIFGMEKQTQGLSFWNKIKK